MRPTVKHHWHEAAFVPDAADTDAALGVIRRFRELRGDAFSGGSATLEQFTGTEARSWWIAGHCVLVTCLTVTT